MTEHNRRNNDEAEMAHHQRDIELKEAIEKMGAEVSRRLTSIEAKVDPMYEMFSSVSGFNRISVWILKLLAAIGAAILALYVVIEFFKKVGR